MNLLYGDASGKNTLIFVFSTGNSTLLPITKDQESQINQGYTLYWSSQELLVTLPAPT